VAPSASTSVDDAPVNARPRLLTVRASADGGTGSLPATGRALGLTAQEGALVVRSQAGDEAAITELAGRVRPLVQRYARRFCADSEHAEDLAQRALAKAFTRVGDVRCPDAFSAWLLRITRNECLNELARQHHGDLSLSTLAASGADLVAPPGGDGDPEEALVRGELRTLVRQVIATLPSHYRRALAMRALEDCSYEEISRALGVPTTIARVWYCRARKRFRRAFVDALVSRRGVPATCQELGAGIAAMLEGTLAGVERERLRVHLAGCAVCRQTEEELLDTAFRTPGDSVIAGLSAVPSRVAMPDARTLAAQGPRDGRPAARLALRCRSSVGAA